MLVLVHELLQNVATDLARVFAGGEAMREAKDNIAAQNRATDAHRAADAGVFFFATGERGSALSSDSSRTAYREARYDE